MAAPLRFQSGPTPYRPSADGPSLFASTAKSNVYKNRAG
ncbi:hypothetical protein [Azospirillum endophyticum]